MTRIERGDIAHHLELALSTAPEILVSDMVSADPFRRVIAIADVAAYLADRLTHFELVEGDVRSGGQPGLFDV